MLAQLQFPAPKFGTHQHTVPQLLLRPFLVKTPRGMRVWVWDKRMNMVRDRPIRRILCHAGFYDESASISLDGFLSGIEDQFAKVVHSIRQYKTIAHLDVYSQRILSLGFAIQYIRTPKMRALIQGSRSGQLRDTTTGQPLDASKDWYIEEYGDASASSVQLDWLSEWTFDLAGAFLCNTTWALLSPSGSLEFVISDHPVACRVLSQQSEFPDQMTFYLPLSPLLTLTFSGRDQIPDCQRVRRVGFRNQILDADTAVDDDEVRLMNRLQCDGSQQYIISRLQTMQQVLI